MMKMEHSDLILSGPYFTVRTAKMDRSRHAVLLWTNLFKQIVLHRPKRFLFRKSWMEKRVRAEIETRKYVLGQQKKSTSNERQTEFASPELNSWS